MIRVLAPAKVNLSFEVLGRRDDGFHEVQTVLQAIDLADVIEVKEAPKISLTVEPGHAVPVTGNLVLQAARALHQAMDLPDVSGATITLHKRIPVAAGLGGGSSDAAATLLALRRLWSVDVDMSLIYRIAASIGTDVPFFLRGGTAWHPVGSRGRSVPPPSPAPPASCPRPPAASRCRSPRRTRPPRRTTRSPARGSRRPSARARLHT